MEVLKSTYKYFLYVPPMKTFMPRDMIENERSSAIILMKVLKKK